MKSSHARIIHPFRSSGLNPRPQPREAPQSPSDDWDAPPVRTMSLPPRKPTPRMQAHLANMEGVTLGEPPWVPASAPTVAVFIDGMKVRLPANWAIAFSSSGGKDTICAVDAENTLHLLTLNADGLLRELHGLSADLVSDIMRWRFPRGTR